MVNNYRGSEKEKGRFMVKATKELASIQESRSMDKEVTFILKKLCTKTPQQYAEITFLLCEFSRSRCMYA